MNYVFLSPASGAQIGDQATAEDLTTGKLKHLGGVARLEGIRAIAPATPENLARAGALKAKADEEAAAEDGKATRKAERKAFREVGQPDAPKA